MGRGKGRYWARLGQGLGFERLIYRLQEYFGAIYIFFIIISLDRLLFSAHP